VNQPLVSVVTPFHNTAAFLGECIKSVLAQTYTQFEYVLVDNCSTDASGEIAESHARRDSRIRLIRRTELLSQVQNYNGALAAICDTSKYCKIVQADDYIVPDCLRSMVQAFEQSESIGLVSGYDLKADVVRGSGFPHRMSPISGKEAARLYLQNGIFPFGSPTTVMYRSSLVRGPQPFYDESRLHEDTEKCMQILEDWDFAFVPQVLSFLRADNVSISSAVRNFQPYSLDRYIIVQRYAPVFLGPGEAKALKQEAKRDYYQVLAHAALRLRGKSFWRYHETGLKTLGEKIEWLRLAFVVGCELLWIALNPGFTVRRIVRYVKRNKD
jgi:glycosyltransferase involved in cell wall biosynthesis